MMTPFEDVTVEAAGREAERAQQAKANGADDRPKVPIRSLYWTLEDIAGLAPPEWIIEGLLPRRTKILIFGESGHYKTMHAVDQLCRVAHGMDCHGLAVPASFPVVFLANEDAYGLAVQRVQGWHQYHGKPDGRVIIIPGNTCLDRQEDVERAVACARDAFGDTRPVFAIDTWDRSITGNPNSTEDVNPALTGLDTLLAAGEATVTISHSPWSDKNRTKGAVTFWANHDTRIKAEKDEVTGRGVLTVIHQKNARAGLEDGVRVRDVPVRAPRRSDRHPDPEAGLRSPAEQERRARESARHQREDRSGRSIGVDRRPARPCAGRS